MLPHTRIRAPRELSENVPVRSNEPLLRHASPAAALRRRIGKRSSTLFFVACGTLFVVCVIAVYLLTVSSNAPPVRRVSGAANETAPTPVKTLVTEVPTAAVPAATTTTTTTTTPTTAEATAAPLTPSTQIPTPNVPMVYINIFDREDTRTARPVPVFDDIMEQYEEGEYEPEEPDRLPGLTVTRRTYTPEELMNLHNNTDFIYSFVNGSEVTHHYRKATVGSCQDRFRELERTVYTSGGAIPTAMLPELNNNTPVCSPNYLQKRLKEIRSVSEMINTLNTHIRPGIGDRETDELRHSIRSVEQHVGWHRGRVVIVSPGHHPTWVDGAKNFLAGVCGDATVQALRTRGTHLRLTTVHQDAIMPYGIRLTVDSHSIEQHIWRVRNTTAVHVYMNDDYFVNRDVAITDLFNEYGGTIVRTEKGILKDGIRAAEGTGTWGDGVRNTHMFNIIELDMRHDDYLPDNVEARWLEEKKEKHLPLAAPIPPIAIDEIIDAAHMYGPAAWPRRVKPRRHRRYATHAPFVYCTNMHRFMQTRYALDFAHNSYNHRGRKARDLYVPFVYNAFVMARPWVASPQFLPYLLQLRRSRTESPTEAAPVLTIPLDNFNSCGPATLRGGRTASHCLYGKFVDNLTANDDLAERIRVANPLYFNVNAGFNTEGASNQLRQFLHNKFPTPAYLEAAATTTAEEAGEGDEEDHTTVAADTAAADAVLQSVFAQLMALPVVGLVSYEEGVCPLVRSLPLAFAGHHRGRVHVAVQRHGDGESDESLRDTRARLEHRVVSAMPALRCAYDSRVSVGASARGESVSDAAARVLVDGDGAGVELPATCGGGLAGLRVRGFVVDARTPGAPVASRAALRDALAMPGQTLALEDFRAVRVGPEDGDVVLVLAREDAAAKAVHWIGGASENDLLVTYPLPVEAYEDMSAPLRWTSP